MVVLVGVIAPQFIKYVKKSRVAVDCDNAANLATALQVAGVDEEEAAILENSLDNSRPGVGTGYGDIPGKTQGYLIIDGGTTLGLSSLDKTPVCKVDKEYKWFLLPDPEHFTSAAANADFVGALLYEFSIYCGKEASSAVQIWPDPTAYQNADK